MQDAKVRAALFVVCLACLLGSGIVLYAGHHAQAPPVIITSPTTSSASPPAASPTPTRASQPPARIYVDVAGAVQRPSLYVLPAGSRVMQALLAAGGPTGEADLDAVNLAEKVTDGEKVYVPKRGSTPTSATLVVPPAPPSPHAVVNAVKSVAPSRPGKLTADSGEQIALNSATAEQLERLPGVGPGMAGRILAYREQAGGFGKIEDLMQVTGIGPKKFAKIAPLVKLN